jgi:outer membrane protein assembly factor BamB
VWACGPDGKARWKVDDVQNPADVQFLAGGRLLIAECQGYVITERDRQGKIYWSKKVSGNPVSCQRLANGNTFIATYTSMLEVTRDGTEVYSHKHPNSIYCAQKLRNGHILFAHSSGHLIEIETNGKEVRRLAVSGLGSWAGVELLSNGHFLVAQYASNHVVELDAAGKVFWEGTVQTPAWCTRLRNGNTLVASTDAHCVVELDRAGKEVWKRETPGRPFRVRRQ